VSVWSEDIGSVVPWAQTFNHNGLVLKVLNNNTLSDSSHRKSRLLRFLRATAKSNSNRLIATKVTISRPRVMTKMKIR